MRNTTRSLYVEVIYPAFIRFVENYSNREIGLRRDTALSAAVAGSLRDLPEHVFHDVDTVLLGVKTPEQYRDRQRDKHHFYRVTEDFANCWKHRTLNRKNRTLNSLDDITESVAIIICTDDIGRYPVTRKIVEAKLRDGTFVDLGRCIAYSFDMWTSELIRLGIIPSTPVVPKMLPASPSRDDVRFKGKITMLGNVGEPFKQGHRVFFCEEGNDLIPAKKGDRIGTIDVECEAIIGPSIFPSNSN